MPTDSRFCESLSRFRATLAGALGCLAAAGAFAADPAVEDDHQRGARAYRGGDLVAAATALRRAADAGHAPSQVLLASILDQAEYDAEAIAWYRKAAQQGDAGGAFGLGTMYLAGEGVKRDLGVAYEWLSRAAEAKHEQATVTLAAAYIRAAKGELAAGPDPARASEWLHKAAALESLPAIDALAAAYQAGGFGIGPDAAKASEYAARAAAIRKKMSPEKGRKKK